MRLFSTLMHILILGIPFPAQANSGLKIDTYADGYIIKELVDNFIASKEKKEIKETAQSQGYLVSDLNTDGNKEIILLWTTMGPTYWRNNLTIFTKINDQYTSTNSLQLVGEAKLNTTKNNIIFLDQKIYGNNDPICCPSVDKQVQYRWENNNLFKNND